MVVINWKFAYWTFDLPERGYQLLKKYDWKFQRKSTQMTSVRSHFLTANSVGNCQSKSFGFSVKTERWSTDSTVKWPAASVMDTTHATIQKKVNVWLPPANFGSRWYIERLPKTDNFFFMHAARKGQLVPSCKSLSSLDDIVRAEMYRVQHGMTSRNVLSNCDTSWRMCLSEFTRSNYRAFVFRWKNQEL